MFIDKLKSREKVCKIKDFCGIVMAFKKYYILQFNQYIKSDKMAYNIYADLESLIKKIHAWANNPEISSTIKTGEHFAVDIQCRLYGVLVL